MIKNYFKTAFRNLWKSKGFSSINIIGLSIGMAAAILILLWVQNETSMDRFFEKENRTYLMYNRDHNGAGEIGVWPNMPMILATTLKQDYPEVEDVVRYRNVTFLLSSGEKHLNIRGAFTDSGFLNIFDFPLLEGHANNSLTNIYSIAITQKLAKKFFGNESALGKTILVDSVHNCTITAVLKDLPSNTSFDFEYLLPWTYMTKIGWTDSSWVSNSPYTYTLLKPNTSQASFDQKIKNITIDHTKGRPDASSTEVFTQPLGRAYLYSEGENGKLDTGPIERVRLFTIIAGFILLIACINFMNLSTARSEKRAKEVGIRKVMGAYKSKLILQFLCESIFLSFIAFVIALFLVEISLKSYSELVGKELTIDFANPAFWIFASLFILFSGLLAGSYPAFFLSAFQPVKVLKGTFNKVNAAVNPRKVLVVLQFTFATILIVCTVIVQRQIKYGLDRDTGYDQNNLVYTFAQGEIPNHYESIKNELQASQTVLSMTRCANPITRRWSDSWGFMWDGSTKEDEKIDFICLGSDVDFTKTIGVKLIKGRDIDIYQYPTDSSAILLNESAVKAMRLKDPLGQHIKANDGRMDLHVVGVISDFILESPYQKNISPVMVLGPGNQSGYVVHIRLNPAKSMASNLAKLKEVFEKYNTQYPFETVFADESYARKFDSTQRTGKLALLFAGLTIFISCLGLFALATYMAENRTREIGVRKVLGASVPNLVALLSKDFLKLVFLSFVIAIPIAWYAMHEWLSNYSYRVQIEWWVFVGTGILVVLISLLTISFQSIRSALANPVKSLRTE